MALSWKVVTTEHVRKACQVVAARHGDEQRTTGLVVIHEKARLRAKDVARVAYLLATNQPLDADLRFASGETMLNFLRKHGCLVERTSPRPKEQRQEGGT
jgi:hypothetical protein